MQEKNPGKGIGEARERGPKPPEEQESDQLAQDGAVAPEAEAPVEIGGSPETKVEPKVPGVETQTPAIKNAGSRVRPDYARLVQEGATGTMKGADEMSRTEEALVEKHLEDMGKPHEA